MKSPIYVPSGAAREYGDYALNIYTGCPHSCYYCFAPNVLRRDREQFHSNIQPRAGIVEAVKLQLENQQITDKLIHLCFTCDPYPVGYDSTATREIIKLLKSYGNHVQILTKGDGALRDLDLLDDKDWIGVSYAGYETGTLPLQCPDEPNAAEPLARLILLHTAKIRGINTWVSCEPVLISADILCLIEMAWYIDKWKIGKLNYHPSNINWAEFGIEVEALCKKHGRDYYIKDSLRKEMER